MVSVLSVHAAHKSYGNTQALQGAGATLERGEWLGLLGPNGAGKSTLIRAIAGRVVLDSGDITLLGQHLNGDATAARRARARLGVIPQELALYPLLSARENLRAFGRLHGVHGALLTQRIQWALEWTGLADRADDLSKTFSGGMKRRLNIACGVLHQPEVVLLDEPTVGVDPQSRQRIWDMLTQLRDLGASLLLTTHQLDEAQQICDRIVIIDHGKAIATGTIEQLVEQTIGRSRLVTISFDQPLPADVPIAGGDVMPGRKSAAWRMADVGSELAELLAQLAEQNLPVADVHIESPSLHAVFLHLTGRELRE